MKEHRRKAIKSAIELQPPVFQAYEPAQALLFLEENIESCHTFFEVWNDIYKFEVLSEMSFHEEEGKTIFLLIYDCEYLAWVAMPEPYGVLVEALNSDHFRFDLVKKISSKEFEKYKRPEG